MRWLGLPLVLLWGCPEKQQDEDWDAGPADSPELTPGHFSDVGQAVLDALEVYGGSEGVTWGMSSDSVLDPGWLLQTPPADHWGVAGEDFAVDVSCGQDPDCDRDFDLLRCEVDGDCVYGGKCRPLLATVTVPGELPQDLCVGHSEELVDAVYLGMTSGTEFVDVASLTQPDGRFMAAVRNAVTWLHNSGSSAQVRVMYGSVPVISSWASDTLEEIVRDLPADTPMSVYVGAYLVGLDSWNHSKIVAADGWTLVQGGHNMWTVDYLSIAPVHDVSMQLYGSPAGDAHRFLDRVWEYVCDNPSILDGYTDRDVYPHVPPNCPFAWGQPMEPQYADAGTRVISTGRLGGLGENPADEALLAMLRSAESTIRLSQQDLGPVALVGDLSLSDWPEDVMLELGYAMARGVDVYVVLSEPGSVPGGGSVPYGNGWEIVEVAQTLEEFLETSGVFAPDEDIHAILCEQLHLAPLRWFAGPSWPGGEQVANHAKMVVTDEVAFYVGSQNLYPANLAEFGLIVDDEMMTLDLLQQYWDPMWSWSVEAAVSGWEADACTF